MLAFVFWHHRDPLAEAAAYAEGLRAFHERLAEAPPPGFVRSVAWRLPDVRWLPASTEVYEDWYVVEDFAALGALNDASVDARRRTAHDAVAVQATTGVGGVYRLEAGTLLPARVRAAHWFGKPAGEPTDAFTQRLAPALERPGTMLWRRQMNLGPAPEWVLLAPKPLTLPVDVEAVHGAIGRCWPG